MASSNATTPQITSTDISTSSTPPTSATTVATSTESTPQKTSTDTSSTPSIKQVTSSSNSRTSPITLASSTESTTLITAKVTTSTASTKQITTSANPTTTPTTVASSTETTPDISLIGSTSAASTKPLTSSSNSSKTATNLASTPETTPEITSTGSSSTASTKQVTSSSKSPTSNSQTTPTNLATTPQSTTEIKSKVFTSSTSSTPPTSSTTVASSTETTPQITSTASSSTASKKQVTSSSNSPTTPTTLASSTVSTTQKTSTVTTSTASTIQITTSANPSTTPTAVASTTETTPEISLIGSTSASSTKEITTSSNSPTTPKTFYSTPETTPHIKSEVFPSSAPCTPPSSATTVTTSTESTPPKTSTYSKNINIDHFNIIHNTNHHFSQLNNNCYNFGLYACDHTSDSIKSVHFINFIHTTNLCLNHGLFKCNHTSDYINRFQFSSIHKTVVTPSISSTPPTSATTVAPSTESTSQKTSTDTSSTTSTKQITSSSNSPTTPSTLASSTESTTQKTSKNIHTSVKYNSIHTNSHYNDFEPIQCIQPTESSYEFSIFNYIYTTDVNVNSCQFDCIYITNNSCIKSTDNSNNLGHFTWHHISENINWFHITDNQFNQATNHSHNFEHIHSIQTTDCRNKFSIFIYSHSPDDHVNFGYFSCIYFTDIKPGSAVVNTRLVFNSSTPIPSESLVLSASKFLLSSRLTNITDSMKVLNITYETITESSYAVIFTFILTNISMPDSIDLRNNTYNKVQSTINKVLNTLLNEPDAQPIEPQSSGFTSLANVIKGNMEYHFQDGDTKIPVSFLNELKTLSVSSTTVPPTSTSSLLVLFPSRSGSAVVTTRLIFNSSSPVPSESLVLHATRNLLSSRFTNITDSVKVLNVTYEKITDTSYAVIFTFTLTNISMPDNKTLVNNTYSQVQNTINKVLNTLLNEPDAQPIEPQSSGFTSLANFIKGNMEYHFQDGDTKIPVSFLNELKTLSVSSTTVPPTSTSSLLVLFPSRSGSAVVTTRLIFNSSSPVPSESLVLHATRNLLSSRFTNITDSVKVLNVTYEKITDTSYAVIFTFTLTNISMPDNKTLVNNTYSQVQNTINKVLNTLLNEPDAQPIEPQSSGFTSLANFIKGNMEYHFQDGDTKIPVSFLNELKTLSGMLYLIYNSSSNIYKQSGSAVVTTRLVFNSSSPVPSESLVLNATRNLLSSRFTNITDSVNVFNVTYEKITDTSYAVIFTFKLTNISMPDNKTLVNNTYSQVQNTINKVLNTLLNEPDAQPIEPQSSGFTSLANFIKGNMEYHFQDGDTKIPVSFLNELKTLSASSTTVPPTSTSSLVVLFPSRSGSAVVTTRLIFNSSSPVPSESLVLHATRNLLSSRFTNITDSVKVLNVTYEKITDTSYAVIFTFTLTNISMPDNKTLVNNTYSQVQNTINKVLNTLLNEPDAQPIEPQSSGFTSLANFIKGNMEYHFQDGDTKIPVSFLNELKTLSVSSTTVPPTSTSSLLVLFPSRSGSAVVTTRLIFNSSSPVPSESLVLNATRNLLSSRFTNITDSVNVFNVTYEKITDTSYAVIFTFKLTNISMPDNKTLVNNTYSQVQNTINKVLNTLLNEPDAQPIEPQSSGFTSLANFIKGNMEYHFQDGDTKIPVSFLNELKTLSASSTTVPPTSTSSLVVTSETTPSIISGSAVVTTRLVFNSSSPVPSESLVLNATRNLLSSRFTNITDSVKVLNVTYEKITDTSYAVIFTFTLTNISIPDNKTLVNNTYSQVQNTINKVLNTLLNEPDAQPIEPQSSGFTSLANFIKGNMEYHFQDGDTKIPVSFLNELKTLSVSSTTVPPTSTSSLVATSETTPSIISGSAVVTTRLVFNSSSPVPSESLVLNATRNLLSSRFTNITDSVNVFNVTYEKITDTSYAVIFTFKLTNISMPDNKTLVNNTYSQVQNTINKVLNTLLNEPDAQPIEPQSSGFTSLANFIKGNMEYHFQDGDTKIPVSFLNELKTLSASSTTVPPTSTSSLVVTSETTPSIISGSAVVTTRLVFNSSSPVPSESLVLNATRNLLSSRFTNITDSVKVLNVTYEKITDTSYAVIFTFTLTNISIPDNKTLVNNTYSQVQNTINKVLNTLLNEPDAQPIEPQSSGFTSLANFIKGNMEYHFQDGDTKIPVSFLNELKTLSGMLYLIYNSSSNIYKQSGSAVVTTRLVFNSSSPVPSESLVLNATRNLLSSRFTNITDSVNVFNVTYETSSTTVPPTSTSSLVVTSETTPSIISGSAVVTTRLVFNSSSPVPSASLVLNATRNLLSSRFTNITDSVKVLNVTYETSSTTVPPTSTSSLVVTSETRPSIISGSAVVTTRLVFNSSSPFPSESLVLNVTRNLLSSRFTNITDSVKVLNVTYEKISITSYAVIFIFSLSNISMPNSPVLRNSTYSQVQSYINKALNSLINDPDSVPIEPLSTKFIFRQVTVLIYIRVMFKNLMIVPNKAQVLAAYAQLDPSVRTKRDITNQKLNDPVSIQTITYEKMDNTSFSISFVFRISNVSMATNIEMSNETYYLINLSINNLLNKIMNNPDATPFVFPQVNFSGNATVIVANTEYVYVRGDIKSPSGFLAQILQMNTILTKNQNVTFPPANITVNFTVIVAKEQYVYKPGDINFPSAFLAEILKLCGLAPVGAWWVLGIIIPCAIVIILVPCWILLCCLLCGWCAAIRRRYNRRRSYSVQYTTRNGLF
ncbi:serine-rich adhesin for platelets [Electrophorus electricus]|uniref:serine-rich adhesin for platelets n=1 Tax=Electrophorus electricus TaxID=8005 RepID=UPI0015D0BD59|nr:serine-rich adhesin for platelets [Electrophorus electricus]